MLDPIKYDLESAYPLEITKAIMLSPLKLKVAP